MTTGHLVWLDYFYDELKDKDIDYINSGGSDTSGSDGLDGDLFREDIDDREGIEYARSLMLDDHLDLMSSQYGMFNPKSNYFDSQGNVRVLRIFWRSLKQILKITYYDEQGDEQV